MAVTEQEMLEDLAYTEFEGPADMGEDDWDRLGEADDFDAFGGEDDFEAEDYAEDMYESEDLLEAEEAEESVANQLGAILGAEDEDEFFGKLLGGIKSLAKKAAPFVGKLARGAAPILSMIPHPAAQVAGKVAGVLGKLKSERWFPRPTVLRDTALQVEDCKEVEDGRGRWGGRGPVGARPRRWRRRVHARAPTADVGAAQAGRRAEAVAG